MQWFARPLTREEIRAFREHADAAEVGGGFRARQLPHQPRRDQSAVSRQFASRFVGGTNPGRSAWPALSSSLHPGAHLGAGEEAGLEKVVTAIDRIFAGIPKVKTRIALETTAGQGSSLGHTFEHLAHIIGNVREPERLCVCLDTAHVFAAGFDLTTRAGTRKMFQEFERTIGLHHLVALHLNDSKTARGSRVDRHEHIGKGQIGLEAFRCHHARPAFPQNPESARNSERQRVARRRRKHADAPRGSSNNDQGVPI